MHAIRCLVLAGSTVSGLTPADSVEWISARQVSEGLPNLNNAGLTIRTAAKISSLDHTHALDMNIVDPICESYYIRLKFAQYILYYVAIYSGLCFTKCGILLAYQVAPALI